MNQTVTKSLVKYINADQDDWDEHLESVLFSYRTSVHATTKYTPFFLMYGREAVLPIQLHTSNVDNGHAIPEIESEAQRHAARLDTIRTETFMKVASNIENAQAKQKLYYDRKHAKAEFKLGSPVLLRNMRKLSRKGGKMDDEWIGPFTIAEVCDKGLYLLKNEHGKVLKKLYNSIQLKTYEERQIHEAASDLGQVHAGASDEEIASKIEQDFTASHNEESASKERLAIGVTDSHNEKIYGSEISTRELLHEQLFSPQLFRLWRTGANELAFNPAEDDDDFDVSYSVFNTLFYVRYVNLYTRTCIS